MDLGQTRYVVQIKSRVSEVQMECILKKKKKNICKQKKKKEIEEKWRTKCRGCTAAKNHGRRKTLILLLLSHSTDIISLFIYPLVDGSSLKKGRDERTPAGRWKIARFNKAAGSFRGNNCRNEVPYASLPSFPVIVIFPFFSLLHKLNVFPFSISSDIMLRWIYSRLFDRQDSRLWLTGWLASQKSFSIGNHLEKRKKRKSRSGFRSKSCRSYDETTNFTRSTAVLVGVLTKKQPWNDPSTNRCLRFSHHILLILYVLR